MKRLNVTLDEHTEESLRNLGGGNLSAGIRRAGEIASAAEDKQAKRSDR